MEVNNKILIFIKVKCEYLSCYMTYLLILSVMKMKYDGKL